MKQVEGVFLELTKKDVEVISRVTAQLGSEYSPNGIVRVFYILDKYASVISAFKGKAKPLDVIQKFIFQ